MILHERKKLEVKKSERQNSHFGEDTYFIPGKLKRTTE